MAKKKPARKPRKAKYEFWMDEDGLRFHFRSSNGKLIDPRQPYDDPRGLQNAIRLLKNSKGAEVVEIPKPI